MIGTLFIADEADFLSIPGNASSLVDMSHADLDEPFLLKRERLNRLCRTNPSAKIAEFFTIPNTGDKSWCVKTWQACF
jgi:hypothetical protein